MAQGLQRQAFALCRGLFAQGAQRQQAFARVDAIALKGAEAEVLSKFLKNMSKRAGTMLEEEMAFSGPVRVKDVDEAKRSILTELRDLEQKGEIVVARQGAEEFVV